MRSLRQSAWFFLALSALAEASRLRSGRGSAHGFDHEALLPLRYLAGDATHIHSRAVDAEKLLHEGLQAAASLNSSHTIVGHSHEKRVYDIIPPVQDNDTLADKENATAPRLFFLFLTYEGLMHMDLWQEFFSSVGATTDHWSALLHCKDQDKCQKQLERQNPLGLKLVKNVSAEYCVDLVSPMVRLLTPALALSGSPKDKFIFLSESTLPVKPFASIYRVLTVDENSDICISPRKGWAKISDGRKDEEPTVLIRHSQWSVLSVTHAKLAVRRWSRVRDGSPGKWTIPVWLDADNTSTEANFTMVPTEAASSGSQMCTDEWAMFATVFGAVRTQHPQVDMPGMTSPTILLESVRGMTETQGTCRTFETWGGSVGADGDVLGERLSALLSCFPNCTDHPAHFLTATDRSLELLRNSSFLFARKIPANLVDADQFSRVILGEPFPWATIK